MNEQIILHISGHVQGVCFRAYTVKKATELSLTGQVRNLADGLVEVIAQGAKPHLDELIAWCHEGPPHASVSSVITTRSVIDEDYEDFQIVY